MSFHEKYNFYYNLINEQGEDAAAPAPATDVDATVPGAEAQSDPVAPEGYVNLVKLLSKSLAMNIPTGEIDSLFATTKITAENAFKMQDQIEQFLKEKEVQSDNIERLDNSSYKKFVESTTAVNFEQRLKTLIDAMKVRDPYINEL